MLSCAPVCRGAESPTIKVSAARRALRDASSSNSQSSVAAPCTASACGALGLSARNSSNKAAEGAVTSVLVTRIRSATTTCLRASTCVAIVADPCRASTRVKTPSRLNSVATALSVIKDWRIGTGSASPDVSIEADFAKFVHDDSGSCEARILQHLLDERGLAAAEKARDDGHGRRFSQFLGRTCRIVRFLGLTAGCLRSAVLQRRCRTARWHNSQRSPPGSHGTE